MPLLNYTTSIAADKTVMEIQRALAKSGATAILSEYDTNGYIIAMSFKINLDGQSLGYRLPTDWRPVQQVLMRQRVSKTLQTQEQAVKVAWRITKDWIEAQLAIIETKMVKPEQVFLPYMVQRNGQTLYENAVSNKFFLEEGGK